MLRMYNQNDLVLNLRINSKRKKMEFKYKYLLAVLSSVRRVKARYQCVPLF